jgi:hypothetical protein
LSTFARGLRFSSSFLLIQRLVNDGLAPLRPQLDLGQRRAVRFEYFVEGVRDLGPAISRDFYGSVDRALHEL